MTSTGPHPERLGRYRLLRRLGAGGEGQVFEAVLEGPGGLRKPVAIKLLHPVAAGRAEDARLRREARIGGLLRHRNLVDVYEIGEVDGRWFCAMELCDGSLAGRPPLSPRAVADVGLQVCAALAYARDALDLVHRDLKPENLLLLGAVVKVADFGMALARGFASDAHRSAGTPRYRPPEAARGPVDARGDLYALGVTLTELADGSGAPAETWLDDAPIAAPSSSSGSLSEVAPALAAILARCTHPDPEQRFPSAQALAEALQRVALPGDDLAASLGVEAPARRPDGVAERPAGAFVGRAEELDRLDTCLAEPGVVALKGPPGIGKTRLAREAAHAWQAATRRRVWWCELGPARDEEGLIAAMGRSLGVPLRGPTASQARALGLALAGRDRCLIVLDDAGHLPSLGPRLDAWRRAAPEASFLVTSHRAVGADDERTVALGPLSEAEATAMLAACATSRGVAALGDLAPLARALDGVPLALELAAGRLGILSASEVSAALGLDVLRGGEAGRHATLRDAIDWTCRLLSPGARRALGRVAVFEADFAWAAAASVVGDDRAADLAELVEHSLVRVVGDERLAVSRPLRLYARDDADPAERREAEARHGAWYADPAFTRVGTALGVERLRALGRELPDVLAACERALDRGDEPVIGATAIAAAIGLSLVGPLSGAPDLLRRAVEAVGDPAVRGRLLMRWWLAARAADGQADEGWLIEAERLGLERDDPGLRSLALELRATAALDAGRTDDARAHVEEADRVRGEPCEARAHLAYFTGRPEEARRLAEHFVRKHRNAGDARGELLGWMLQSIAEIDLGLTDDALRSAAATLAISEAVGDGINAGRAHGNLGALHADLGHLAQARAHYEESLRIQRELGNVRSVGHVSGNLGNLCLEEGDLAAAIPWYDRSVEASAAVGDAAIEGLSRTSRSWARASLGQRDASVLDDARRGVARAVASGVGRAAAHARDRAAQTLLVLGHVDEAAELLDAIGDDVRAYPSEQALVDLTRAAVRRAADRPGAEELLAGALAAVAGTDGAVAAGRKARALGLVGAPTGSPRGDAALS